MSALEDAKAALDDLRHGIPRRGEYPEYDREHDDIDKIDALIAEHERLAERLEEAYRIGADGWREAIEKAEEVKRLTAPPTDDEREALGWREAEAYADDHEPSRRAETADDFMQGWRTADRTRRQGSITEARVRAAALDELAESYIYVHAVSRVTSQVYKWLRSRADAALEAARSAES